MTQAFDDCLPAAQIEGPEEPPAPVQDLSRSRASLPCAVDLAGDTPVLVIDAPSPRHVDYLPPTKPARRDEGGGPARRRLGGLDGLRAIAVLAVVAFHLDFSLSPGGFLGVDVFFVISGFLITNLLATEILATGRLDLKRFYIRRARRLLPAVLALLLVITIAGTTIWRDQLATLKGGVISSLTYVTNWWLIADHQSYFAFSGRPPMVQHLWSLAIEEQFYLVWSPVVLGIAGAAWFTRRRPDPAKRLRAVIVVALLLAGLSTLLMAIDANREHLPYGGSVSRVYFGSDTHTMGLFLGCAAGAWLALARRAPTDPFRKRAVLVSVTDVVGLAAIAVVVYQFFAIDEYRPGLYRGGFLAFDAVVLLAILCAVRPGSLFGRLLDIRPMRWVGLRSYSIYLWHWPIAVVTRPQLDVHGPTFLINLERFVLILGVATLSYHFIEVPLRSGQWRVWQRERRRGYARRWELGALAWTLAAGLALVIAARPVDAAAPPLAGLSRISHAATFSAPPAPPSDRPGSRAPHGPAQSGRPTSHHTRSPATGSGKSAHHRRVGAQHRTSSAVKPAISAFGDSVLLGARLALRADTRHLHLDAVEGRQAYDVLGDISEEAKAGRLAPNVLIHIGDNGIIDPAQLASTLRQLRDRRRVVLMTVRVPREWQDPDNAIIRNAAKQFSNVVLVDWYALSAGHVNWFYDDGIHLTPAGATGYAKIAVNAFRGPAPTS